MQTCTVGATRDDSKCGRRFWKGLAAGSFLVFLLSGCLVIPIKIPLASPPQTTQPEKLRGDRPSPQTAAQTGALVAQSKPTAQMEAQVVQRINDIRQQRGLNRLQLNEKLARVARTYSKQMAEENFFSHTDATGNSPGERVKKAGIFYFMVGENLFKCTNAPEPVPLSVEGWMNSPGHRENILRPNFKETGVGIWRVGNTYYFTQLFLRAF